MQTAQMVIGALVILVVALLWERDRDRRHSDERQVDALARQLQAMSEKLEAMRAAQMARMNYESLNNMDNAGAQYAAAMSYLALAQQLMQSGADYLFRAHNPGKK